MNSEESISEKQLELPKLPGSFTRISFKDPKNAKIAEVEVTGEVLK
jgi:hypothetical protein